MATKTKASASKGKGTAGRRFNASNFASVARETTRKKAAQLAVGLVEFQKTTLGTSIDAIGKLQDQSGKFIQDTIKNMAWVPGEGKEVVDEWNKLMKKGREDFRAASDKSFDLIIRYLRRVEKQAESDRKPAAAKPAAAKPAASKKSTAKKAGPKKAAAKRKPKGSTTTASGTAS